MMTAKTRGKSVVVPFDESARERPSEQTVRRDDVRSIAHLKMLQSLSGKLSRLNDVTRIGLMISDELRLLSDYHNCRVFLRDDDDLVPVAFRGDLTNPDLDDPVTLLHRRRAGGDRGPLRNRPYHGRGTVGCGTRGYPAEVDDGGLRPRAAREHRAADGTRTADGNELRDP
jgi:hypothetical protein